MLSHEDFSQSSLLSPWTKIDLQTAMLSLALRWVYFRNGHDSSDQITGKLSSVKMTEIEPKNCSNKNSAKRGIERMDLL